jgi:hypothetical protein
MSLRHASGLRETCAGYADSNGLGDRWSRSIAGALRFYGGAMLEAFLAYRQYEQLRSRGVPHDGALRNAMGVGQPECERRNRSGVSPTTGNLPMRNSAALRRW